MFSIFLYGILLSIVHYDEWIPRMRKISSAGMKTLEVGESIRLLSVKRLLKDPIPFFFSVR